MSDLDQPATAEAATDDKIQWGESLLLSDCYPITAREKTIFVVLAGPSESGKTTFLINLFDSFQKGKFAGFLFAGSKTLIGFERRLNIWRNSDPLHQPGTVRTPDVNDPEILHLRLAHEYLPEERVNLLIGDISGERFKAARNSSSYLKSMTFLKSADSVVFFSDAKQISSEIKIEDCISESRIFARRLRQEKILPSSCRIQSVISRADLISDRRLLPKAIERIDAEISQEFSALGHSIHPGISLICEPIESFTGMDTLLYSWLSSNALDYNPTTVLPKSQRSFLGFRSQEGADS